MNISALIPQRRLSVLDFALLVLVVFIWGTNFVVIRVGLDHFPPILFAFLRFFFTAFPLIFIVPKPDVQSRWLAMGGLAIGAQFGILYLGIQMGMTPGLAALLMQTQVFLTVAFAAALFKEVLSIRTIIGMGVAAAGLLIIAFHLDSSTTLIGLLLTLSASSAWACGNLVIKYAKRHAESEFSLMGYMIWSSAFAIFPLALLMLQFEGLNTALQVVKSANMLAWGSVLWQTIGNTLFGFSIWNLMLTRYSAVTVTPFALLVPIFGLLSSVLLLGEPMPAWKLTAAGLVLLGLAITVIVFHSRKRMSS